MEAAAAAAGAAGAGVLGTCPGARVGCEGGWDAEAPDVWAAGAAVGALGLSAGAAVACEGAWGVRAAAALAERSEKTCSKLLLASFTASASSF